MAGSVCTIFHLNLTTRPPICIIRLIPKRQPSNLSASVPALSRHALPQPAPSTSAEPSHTLPSRMSMWFSHLMPASSGSTAPAEVATGPSSGYVSSPPRKGPSVAASFLNAARQKAVDGVRNLLDSEAQPDKCPDTIWVMGVGHPGYRPSTPVGSPGNQDVDPMETIEDEPVDAKAAQDGITKASPNKTEHVSLRPSAWKKDQTTSPPSKGFTNLFSGSNISLSLPSSMSPGKEAEHKPSPADSPSKGRKAKVEKEIIKWPEQCTYLPDVIWSLADCRCSPR